MTVAGSSLDRAPVVVTGASGFVGRRVVRAVLAEGVAVRALVRDPGAWVQSGPLDTRLTLHRFDLGRPAGDELRSVFHGASAVVHAAAFIPRDHQDPAVAGECLRVNALGTLSLLEAASRAGVPAFVHFSSGNIYLPRAGAVTEDAPIYPSSRAPYYLASKACAETWVDHFRRARGLAAAVLRVSSVYGPGMATSGMIPTFAARLRAGERVRLVDGGRFTADLVHVEDVVDAALRVLERRAAGCFNVGSGAPSTALEVATKLARLLGRDATLLDVEPAAEGSGSVGFSALDISKARAALGYAPRGLDDGLASYVSALP